MPVRKPEHQQHRKARREDRQHAKDGIAGNRQDQHAPPPDLVGQPAEAVGADQHAEEEQCARLQRLRHRQPEGGRDRGRGEADGQHLHGIGCPDETENPQKPALKGAGSGPIQSLVD
jgi:hypothetical protein